MGYGYGVGFIRASSDINLLTTNAEITNVGSGIYYVTFKKLGTTTPYQVPNDKTALIALERTIVIDTSNINIPQSGIGYADDSSGTNFVMLASLRDLNIDAGGNERYWILTIPSNKFPMFKIVTSNTVTGYRGIQVLFEV
jgi:hypothetical protein